MRTERDKEFQDIVKQQIDGIPYDYYGQTESAKSVSILNNAVIKKILDSMSVKAFNDLYSVNLAMEQIDDAMHPPRDAHPSGATGNAPPQMPDSRKRSIDLAQYLGSENTPSQAHRASDYQPSNARRRLIEPATTDQVGAGSMSRHPGFTNATIHTANPRVD